MKRQLSLRMCSVCILLTLLALTIPPSGVSADGETVDLDSHGFSVGDNVRVSAEAFNPSYRKSSGDWAYVYVRVYFSSDWADVGDSIGQDVVDYEIVDKSEKVDKDGKWKVSFTVPAKLTDGEDKEKVTGGTYYLYVTYKGNDEIVALVECDVEGLSLRRYEMWPWSRYSSRYRCFPSPWFRPYPPFFRDWPDDWPEPPDELPWPPDDMPWPPGPDWYHPPACD